MRCNPPLAQQAALEHFDSLVRDCFSSFTGLHLVQIQWEQVTRGLAQAGLSLRSASDRLLCHLMWLVHWRPTIKQLAGL
jgi:hypothetical protein